MFPLCVTLACPHCLLCQLNVVSFGATSYFIARQCSEPIYAGKHNNWEWGAECLQELCGSALYPVRISARGRSIHTAPTSMNMLCSLLYKRGPLLMPSSNLSQQQCPDLHLSANQSWLRDSIWIWSKMRRMKYSCQLCSARTYETTGRVARSSDSCTGMW